MLIWSWFGLAGCVESNVYSFGIIISEMLSRKVSLDCAAHFCASVVHLSWFFQRPYEGKFGSPVAQSVVKDGLRPVRA